MKRRLLLSVLGTPALIIPALATPALAQSPWPNRPIRIIVPFAAGGSPDVIARRLAAHFTQSFGQPAVVENRTGAGGIIASEAVAKAAPDGHTLGISNALPHVTSPLLNPATPYDPLHDFTHLAILAGFPLALGVSAAGPIQTLEEFLAASRAKPGGASIGTPGQASLPHIGMELLRQTRGLNYVHVPFRGGAPAAVLETIAGRLDATFAGFGEMAANDRIRVIAMAAEQRLPSRPELPTFRDSGLDLVATVWFGLCAPAGLPPAIAARLSEAAIATAAEPSFTASLTPLGLLPGMRMGMPQAGAYVASELARWGEVVRQANITAG
ncbi:tripartite tricarboxylate transporter substrate binding protein [Sediminicoccus sp. KRV36]|uniref:Bug family tripartite tricarboxylate transporter substrate binding protein n=1 Tax=Sediminicoccus sp. KRV36 TaxID=3133721 RepID=UPI00200C2227|nr:tripartite tricarboxylate transporter substrate binding protein [Sediminicoccus rosea]UPY35890.1 tripartite tricarboxylate transporter substrate binding protein [Sediminicoccus rosea]